MQSNEELKAAIKSLLLIGDKYKTIPSKESLSEASKLCFMISGGSSYDEEKIREAGYDLAAASKEKNIDSLMLYVSEAVWIIENHTK